MTTQEILFYLLAVLTINLLPGPDMIYVMTKSLSQGRKAGFAAVFGINTGCLVHILMAAFGLSVLILKSALTFTIVKYLGAAYLIYLGIKSLLAKNHLQLDAINKQTNTWTKNSWQGFLTNVLNPKVALFFLAFLPQFIHPNRGHIALQILLLGSIFICSGTVVNSLVAYFFSSAKTWLDTKPFFLKLQQKLTGIILITLGLRVATFTRSVV